jgi:putative intracellular protease/amidase
LSADDFDAVFYPGGHGPLWDLSHDKNSIALIETFLSQDKPVAAVCHAPTVLVGVKDPKGGPLASGKRITGFSNTEEAAVELTDVVPFLVVDQLKELGGHYERADDWQPHVVVDGLLITG